MLYKSHIDGLLAVVGRFGTSVGIAILDLSLSGHHRMQVVCFDKGLSKLVYDGLLVSRCMLWAGTVPTSVWGRHYFGLVSFQLVLGVKGPSGPGRRQACGG